LLGERVVHPWTLAATPAIVSGATASAADLSSSDKPGHAAQNGTWDPTLATASPIADLVRGRAANIAAGTSAEAKSSTATIAGSRPDSANASGLRAAQRPADTSAVAIGSRTAVSAARR
jgi:hypothetical protein